MHPFLIPLAEPRPLTEASAGLERSGRLVGQIINPGWGSSGYYAPDVLGAADPDRVFPAGTHMFIDHPTKSEHFDRREQRAQGWARPTAADSPAASGQPEGPIPARPTDAGWSTPNDGASGEGRLPGRNARVARGRGTSDGE